LDKHRNVSIADLIESCKLALIELERLLVGRGTEDGLVFEHSGAQPSNSLEARLWRKLESVDHVLWDMFWDMNDDVRPARP